jgi:hypothetical protein
MASGRFDAAVPVPWRARVSDLLGRLNYFPLKKLNVADYLLDGLKAMPLCHCSRMNPSW